MERHYVTFEQAKLFKELGFDEPCNRFYNNNGDISDLLEPEDIKYFNNRRADVQQTFACMAPEQWQVVEWLLTNYGIWVSVQPNIPYVDNDWCFKIFENCRFELSLEGYNTPQEAYSAAFDYIINSNLI